MQGGQKTDGGPACETVYLKGREMEEGERWLRVEGLERWIYKEREGVCKGARGEKLQSNIIHMLDSCTFHCLPGTLCY